MLRRNKYGWTRQLIWGYYIINKICMTGNFGGIWTSFADDILIQFFKLNPAVGIFWIVICILICFLQLLNHVAFSFAATFGFILIDTKILSDVVLVNQVVNYRNDRYNQIRSHDQKQNTGNNNWFHFFVITYKYTTIALLWNAIK